MMVAMKNEAKECFSDTDNNSVGNTADDEPYDPLLLMR